MIRAFVTGASGYIGSRLVRDLHVRGVPVGCVARDPITPVDAGVARPLIEGLSTDTTITDPTGMELFDIQPIAFEQALREAIAEEAHSRRPTP